MDGDLQSNQQCWPGFPQDLIRKSLMWTSGTKVMGIKKKNQMVISLSDKGHEPQNNESTTKY